MGPELHHPGRKRTSLNFRWLADDLETPTNMMPGHALWNPDLDGFTQPNEHYGRPVHDAEPVGKDRAHPHLAA